MYKIFETIMTDIQYADKAEKSLKEFNNWILGVSIGICALIITQLKTAGSGSCIMQIIFKSILTVAMLNVLFVGINKYLLYVRDTKMNIAYGKMKKIFVFAEIRQTPKDDVKANFESIYSDWTNEFNKIETHGKLLNVSLITTAVSVILTGLLVFIAL
jgi:hypothetical protein